MSRPRLPVELTDLAISQLGDDFSALLACALVCRNWVACSRRHFPIIIYDDKVTSFIELIQNPKTTLPQSTRRLEVALVLQRDGLAELILPFIPTFTALHSLQLSQMRLAEFPSHPTVVELTLSNCHFESWAGILGSVASFPRLRHLALETPMWNDSSLLQVQNVAPIDLESLQMDLIPRPDNFHVLRPRKMIFKCFLYSTADAGPTTRYLHVLGRHLTELCLQGPDISSQIDFSRNTNLQRLEIGGVYITSDVEALRVSPLLLPFLPRIAAHCQLQTLTLSVSSPAPPWARMTLTSLSQELIKDLLQIPGLEGLRELRIVLSGLPPHYVTASLEETVSEFLPSERTKIVGVVEGKIVIPPGDSE
ncbi:hypothetical protein FB45DRAFT_74023 [Roridomyces roridus]|uniref:F-box domain-containing protein n=1 Tax=Roridomyces roridus TaxID=1738132 RepID=A0AAD7BNE7_9AGAR|nr:hypothetical protein FB45DRAFT_74023 [Roridomyces roridus]